MLHLRRITTQQRFIPQIDGLRFVAIASVVFFHIYAALERGALPQPILLDTDLPKRGVELFFAISGFILGVPFASRYLLGAPRVRLKTYLLRRLTRLEPPYFLGLFASAAMQYIVAHRSFSDMAPHLLAHSFYLQNLVFGAFVRSVNPVAWSLEVEIQFYTLVPLLAMLFLISDALTRRTVILLTMFTTSVLNIPLYKSTHLHYSILYYCPFFLAGFLLCDLYLKRRMATVISMGRAGILPVALCMGYEPKRRACCAAFTHRGPLPRSLSRSHFVGNSQPSRYHWYRWHVLQSVPLPFNGRCRREARDRSIAFWGKLLGLFRFAVVPDFANRAAFLRHLLCAN